MYPVLRGDEWIGGREGWPHQYVNAVAIRALPHAKHPAFVCPGKTPPPHQMGLPRFCLSLSPSYSQYSVSWHKRGSLSNIWDAGLEILPFLTESGQWWQKWEWEVADWLHLPRNCSSLLPLSLSSLLPPPIISIKSLSPPPIISSPITAPFTLVSPQSTPNSTPLPLS